MNEQQWPLSLLEQVQITPVGAYVGQPHPMFCDCERTLQFFTWWEVRSGWAEVTTNHGTKVARAGQWILIPHGIWRHQRLEEETCLTSLNFRAAWPTGRPVLKLEAPITGNSRGKLVTAARSICKFIDRHESNRDKMIPDREFHFGEWINYRLQLLTFLNELIQHGLSEGATIFGPSSGDDRLDVILADIHRHLHAGPLAYHEWSGRLGLGRSQIDRLAHQYLGCGLKEVRNLLLIDEIRHQLVHGKYSAKELAAKYQFSDPSHFSRWVQRSLRNTPKSFRQKSAK